MRSRTLGIGVALLSCSTLLFAQQGLLGTYEGAYRVSEGGHPTNYSGILEITSAENGKLAGKFKISGPYCSGDYVIEGTYQDSKLEMRTSEGAGRGCGKETLALVSEGDKLVGTISNSRIELKKK